MELALAPNGLSAHAGPAGGFEIGDELGEVAFIFGFASETAERMGLTGTAAAALCRDLLELAASHADSRSAVAECAEIEIERTVAIELAQGTDAIADSGGEDPEVGLIEESVVTLQFGGGDETDGYEGHGVGRWDRGEGLVGSGEASTWTRIGTFERGEGLRQMREQRRGIEEEVEVEVEWIAGGEREAVQVTCSEDEGSRRIGKTAR
jgi:hypothetical protein